MSEEKKEMLDDLFDGPDGKKPADTPDDKTKDGDKEEMVPLSRYKEAEKKISELGESNSILEKWFKENKDLLDPIVNSPEIAEAIINGKIDGNLAKAVLEGKVTIEDAKEITDVKEDVKKEMGKKDFNEASPEEIEKRIEEKMTKKLSSIEEKIENKFSKKELENIAVKNNSDFISNTPDFAEYADDINKWMDKHTDVYDVAEGYYAVKGRRATEIEAEKRKAEEIEAKKKLAANASGGGSQGGSIENEDMLNKIFGGEFDANKG